MVSLNLNGQLLDLTIPRVMGILNITPDSFHDGGHYNSVDLALKQAEKMLSEGASILDIGGMSSRPGANILTPEEELSRVEPIVKSIIAHFPEAFVSIDTVHATVADKCLQLGTHMINDISAGTIDSKLWEVVAKHDVPYVLMHMQGKPSTMQKTPDYKDVILEVLDFFVKQVHRASEAGIRQIIIDPGFGFGKQIIHNYQLLNRLSDFQLLELPILAGISRKSMIWKVLENNPGEALNGTSALHMVALQQGSKILRVHDVKEAVEVIKLWEQLEHSK